MKTNIEARSPEDRLPGLTLMWIALSLGLIAIIFAFIANGRAFDFLPFYCAGQTVLAHADPYRELPLQACEARYSGISYLSANVVIPVPQPPYAFGPLELLALLPFHAAFYTLSLLSLLALALSGRICAQTTGTPAVLVIALLAPLAWLNVRLGQVIPLTFLAVVLCGYLLHKGHDRWATIAALGTMLHPQLGLAICASLFVWKPKTRIPLLIGAGVLGAVALWTFPLPILAEYLLSVLPIHARSEAGWIMQISAVQPLVAVGVPTDLALRVGSIQQVLTMAFGVLIAGQYARAKQKPEMLAWLPALAATIGGTFLHGTALLVALPAGLLIAKRSGHWLAYAALSGVMLNWLDDYITPLIIAAALATIAWVRSRNLRAALILPTLVIALIPLLNSLDHGINLTNLSPIPVVAREFASVSWEQFLREVRPDQTTQIVTLIYKIPIWLGLIALLAMATRQARQASRQRVASST